MSIDKTKEYQKPVGNGKQLSLQYSDNNNPVAFEAFGHLVGCLILHLTGAILPFNLI